MSSILLVEDDAAISNVYSTVLKKEGYTVYQASSGPQALTMLASNKADLILLDIMLPGGMNGFDILMRLKQSEVNKDIPVIMMTNLESEKETALDSGATDYIFKANVDTPFLLEKIKSYIGSPS